MLPLLKSKLHSSLPALLLTQGFRKQPFSLLSTEPPSKDIQAICNIVSSSIGGLDELEARLNGSKVSITSTLVTNTIDYCKNQVPTRRLLRFFSWSNKTPECKLSDEAYNHAVRVFAEKKDSIALDILISDFRKEDRKMEVETFSTVVEALVKLGKEDESVRLFKNLEKFYKCPKDPIVVTSIVHALCAKGHARKAQGVVWHSSGKILGFENSIYKSLLHGWCVHGNVKEARNMLSEMKSLGIRRDLFCYNEVLRCLCMRNLKFNPSGLVPEAMSLMVEMRCDGVLPDVYSFNILLSCLGRTRRVKEACKVLYSMKNSGCSPDWVSYNLVVRVLYLSSRFGTGNRVVNEMIGDGLTPKPRFYHDLVGVLCGVERVDHALNLFERMKKTCVGDYGPVYDILIPKLCRGGEFDKGRQLWDEALERGVVLQCSSDVLDPSITEVFRPIKKVEEESFEESTGKAKMKKNTKKAEDESFKKTTRKAKKKKNTKKSEEENIKKTAGKAKKKKITKKASAK